MPVVQHLSISTWAQEQLPTWYQEVPFLLCCPIQHSLLTYADWSEAGYCRMG